MQLLKELHAGTLTMEQTTRNTKRRITVLTDSHDQKQTLERAARNRGKTLTEYVMSFVKSHWDSVEQDAQQS